MKFMLEMPVLVSHLRTLWSPIANLNREGRSILTLATTIVVGVGIFVGLDARERHEQALQQSSQNNATAARAAAEYARAALESIGLRMEDAVQAHATWRSESRPSAASGHHLLSEIVRGNKHLNGIGWMDAEGYLVASSVGPNRRAINVADEPHFIAQANGKGSGLFLGPPRASRQDGRQIITLSRRLEDPNGKFAGIVTGFSDLQALRVGLERMRLDESIGLRLLMPNKVPLIEVATRASTPLTVARESVDGEVPLMVEAVAYQGTILEAWRQNLFRSVGLWLLFSAVILLGTYRLARLMADRREQEERLRLVIEGTNDGIWDWNLLTHQDYLSPRWKEILGYGDEELANADSTFFELIHPGDAQAVRTALQRHFDEKALYQVECRMRHKDGSWRWIMSRGEAVRDDTGRVVRMVGSITDIGDRKQAEKSLRESEARFREIAEATGGYTWEVDRNWRYTFVSERAEALFGYLPAEMVGNKPSQFMPHGEFSQVEAWIAANKAADGAIEFLEHRTISKSGHIVWQQVQAIPVLDDHGNVAGNRGTGVDITLRKQADAARFELELQLRESQKMQAIGTLAGGIAHDFNNILAAVLGNAELALADTSGNSAATESLEEIRKAGTRGRALVQQILAFSRRQPSERTLMEVAPVVHEAARLLRATIPARIGLEVSCDDAVPPVMGNATQLEQVLINLSTNAMQAIPSGPGRIELRLDSVLLEAGLAGVSPQRGATRSDRPRHMVRISVRDTGIGMDDSVRERIFEPFFTTKPVNEGTGLGLSVVHGIVQAHEGVITVDSAPGKGTCFTVYLPAESLTMNDLPAKVKLSSDPTAPTSSGADRILFLDDDLAMLSLVKRLLERRGYRVSAFSESGVALATLRADPAAFDLVVTDYNMPELSGLEVAREARAIRADLPVAVVSGFIDETLLAQAAEAGVRELIFKADEVEEFCAAVQRLIRGTAKTA